MSAIISHPFRLQANGTVAVVEQSSDQGNAEQIAVLALTERGERPMAPTFGMTPATFAAFSPSELAAGVALHGPPVRIRSVKTTPTDAVTATVDVDFV